jgi:hypothetical protein
MSEDAPEGIKPLLDINAAGGRAELGFVELLGTITTGVPGYQKRYGRDFWADLDAEPSLRRSFDAQMNWRFQVQATQIAERVDWGRFSEVLDVGGGDGMVLAAILQAHPGLRGRVLDLSPPPRRRGSRPPDSPTGRARSPGASSTPCPPGPTPTSCPTSSTTGTTTTPARSSPGAAGPPAGTARWW